MDATFSRLALVVLWRRHVAAYITAFRTQSIALAFVGIVVAWYGHVPELFVVGLLILALKGWIVPRPPVRRTPCRKASPCRPAPSLHRGPTP